MGDLHTTFDTRAALPNCVGGRIGEQGSHIYNPEAY